MKRSVPVLVACLLVTTAVLATAGPNEGGTLILHVSSQAYSVGVGYCGAAGLSSCESAAVTAPADPSQTVVMHALAAFPEDASPRLKGVAFGIAYDASRLVLVEHGVCPEFVLTTDGWPSSGTGARGVWDVTQTGRLTEVAYFVAYTFTSPYYPQSNGKIEAWNKTVEVEAFRPNRPRTRRKPRRLSRSTSCTIIVSGSTAGSAGSHRPTSWPDAKR